MKSRLPVLAVAVLFVLAACTSSGAGSPAISATTATATAATPSAVTSAEAVELTVYGAASLKSALDRAKAAYEAATPGTTVTCTTSCTLKGAR